MRIYKRSDGQTDGNDQTDRRTDGRTAVPANVLFANEEVEVHGGGQELLVVHLVVLVDVHASHDLCIRACIRAFVRAVVR